MAKAWTAEDAVIGALAIDAKCLDAVRAVVMPSDFAGRLSRSCYEAALRLDAAGRVVDAVTIAAEAGGGAELEAYIVGVMEYVPTAVNAAEYAQLVRSEANKRRLSDIAEQISGGIWDGGEWGEVAERAREALDMLGRGGKAPSDPAFTMARWVEYFRDVQGDITRACCPTGYASLDRTLGGGMFKGDVYILAGRPGMGKTTQGLAIAERVAAAGRPVLFCSLEMPEVQITSKRIASGLGLSYSDVLAGRGDWTTQVDIYDHLDKLSTRPLYTVDDAYTVADIERYARNVDGLSLVVVDYLGLLQTGDMKPAPRYEEVTRISAALKALAKRLRVPLLVLAQLNRENTTRQDKRPTLADLRDSGAIEQDAGGVLLLHRESYYSPDELPRGEEMEIIVAKNRHSAPGTVRMWWNGATGEISEMERNMPI